MAFEFEGRTLETDPRGYLRHLEDWSEPLAAAMARADGIELGDDHWTVLKLLRDYYQEYTIAPAVRILVKQMARELGRDKGNTRFLYRLFPDGPARQACRYAGLPRPTGCV